MIPIGIFKGNFIIPFKYVKMQSYIDKESMVFRFRNIRLVTQRRVKPEHFFYIF